MTSILLKTGFIVFVLGAIVLIGSFLISGSAPQS